MFKKPIFWIIFSLISVAAAVGAWHWFPKAFPLITVEITMDRQSALEQAAELAELFGWGPDDYRKAASYRLDSRVQNYVELEAGGAEAYRELLDSGLYSPYTWRVRLFSEREVNETLVRFTPTGVPYGFHEKLSEDEPGPAIPADSARAIAMTEAVASWYFDADAYTLVESSENLRPGGRLDHTFVYERMDEKIGEAEYRVRMAVSGDRLTEFTHFVRVPEAFDRRFEEMRSANNTLAGGSFIVAVILFFFGGCVFGFYYLLRERFLIWKPAVAWGTGIAFLGMLAEFNAWPLMWMTYDTALSTQNYVIQQIAVAFSGFVLMAIIFSIVFMAAESLSRKAFPNHIRLWELWSPGVVSTPQVLGLTAAGFLLVSVDIFYVTGMYSFTTNVLGWWYPSSALFNPDVVAQYFPWLTALVGPLTAAFWEEAMFRAIPIAGAVLLGRRFGGTTWWVIAAFILQAFIFSSAHANYAQQPFYARTVEIFIPAIVFGLLYWFFGLYPAILLHFWYNMVWFSMPVFAASIPGIVIDQSLIIIIGLLPFWLILFRYIQSKTFTDAPDEVYNRSWRPAPEQEKVEVAVTESIPDPAGISISSPIVWRTVLIGGLAGLVLWALFFDFSKDAPPIEISRAEAELFARNHLDERGIELPENWQAHSRIFSSIEMPHRFVWQEAGEDTYRELSGQYLDPPIWYVRFVTFEGDVEERAEEFRVFIAGRDSLVSFRHVLPESRPGARLEEGEARELANQAVRNIHGLNPDNLKFISAESSSLPERTDWTVIYADTLAWTLDEGEARIRVRIAGNEIAGSNRFVYVPEEWSRDYRDSRTVTNVIEIACMIVFILLFLTGAVLGIIRLTKKAFSVKALLVIFGGIVILMLIDAFNSWPLTVAGFSTAQPYNNQMFMMIGGIVIGLLFMGGVMGLIGGMVQKWGLPVSDQFSESPLKAIGYAFFTVAAIMGMFALISSFTPAQEPAWSGLSPAGALIPVIAGAIDPVMGYISMVLLFSLIFGGIHQISGGWQKRRVLCGALLVLSGFILSGLSVQSLGSWLLTGLLTGTIIYFLYLYILRYQMPLIILMAAVFTIMNKAGELVEPMYPGAAIAYLFLVILIGAISWYWYNSFITHIKRSDVVQSAKLKF